MNQLLQKAKINLLDAKINLLQQERAELVKELKAEPWLLISWEELRQYLINNPRFDGKDANPIVSPHADGSNYTYCQLVVLDRLQIGPYFDNNEFPRECDLYVNFHTTWAKGWKK